MRIYFLLILILLLPMLSIADLYVITGEIESNDELFRDEKFEQVKNRSLNCVYINTKEKYDISCSSGGFYGIRFNLYYKADDKSERDQLEDLIRQLKESSKVKRILVEIFSSTNDEIPGLCTPDVLQKRIKK